MKSPYLILVFIILIGILAISSLVLYNRTRLANVPPVTTEAPTSNQPVAPEQTSYPYFVIEGVITEVTENELKLEVDTKKILGESAQPKTVTVKIDETKEFVLYDVSTDKEKPITKADLQKDDNIVVATQETNQLIATQDVFTAKKISKMVGTPPTPSE